MKKILFTAAALVMAWTGMLPAQAQNINGDVAAGSRKIAMCMGCHGIEGYRATFPRVYRVPKISGQGAGYIVAALTAYKQGLRKHPTMQGVASGLSEQDMADVAAYYSSRGSVVMTVVDKAVDVAGLELVTRGGCVGCHGANLSQPILPTYPKIAGQYPDYLFAALSAYKTNTHSLWGRDNPVMGAVVQQFSINELHELARYLSSLPGNLRTTQEGGFK
ncbi:c-type cytochrome [Rhodoferax sp.]|uniref:c-type cytochrome n=1 Tax=Rhodoferax sp. TaxID=50421 RepID=UPI00284038AD|nr:c-type cytochrome [Rhodoferax sp.]MDR3371161.1 c-type cytochrome [Rhodoferax sp.]